MKTARNSVNIDWHGMIHSGMSEEILGGINTSMQHIMDQYYDHSQFVLDMNSIRSITLSIPA